MFLGGFHEICQISCEICWISRNPPDFERPIASNGNAYVLPMYELSQIKNVHSRNKVHSSTDAAFGAKRCCLVFSYIRGFSK